MSLYILLLTNALAGAVLPEGQPAAPDAGTPAPPATQAPAASAPPVPALAASRIAEGDRFMQERRYRDAAFAFQDAANADPTSTEALFKLANAYFVLGYYAQAAGRWSRAAELTQDPAVRKSALENVARAQGRAAQAGGGSPQALGLRPGAGPIAEGTREKARAAYEQGVAQIAARDYAGALHNLTTAIELEPTLAVAFVARGSANIGLRHYADAAADYAYALELAPALAAPLFGLGEANRGLGRPLEARACYERYAASSASDVRPQLQQEARVKARQLVGE